MKLNVVINVSGALGDVKLDESLVGLLFLELAGQKKEMLKTELDESDLRGLRSEET